MSIDGLNIDQMGQLTANGHAGEGHRLRCLQAQCAGLLDKIPRQRVIRYQCQVSAQHLIRFFV